MKEINTEKIEIDGVEYTLFLNRKGLMAWEKYCGDEIKKMSTIQEKYSKKEELIEINDDTNPFDGIGDIEEDATTVTETFRHLYWIMLYTKHQLSISKASELYDKACEEYGENQLISLAEQMIEDINTNLYKSSELKNLPALRQKKN